MLANVAFRARVQGYRERHDAPADRSPALTASLAISGVLLFAMAVTAGYAIVSLPPGARVPVNPGTPEHSVWLSKVAGLAVWLAVGVIAFAALESLTRSAVAVNWAASMRVTLPPAALCVVLAGEAAAVITARQAAGPASASSGLGPGAGARRQEEPAAQGAGGGAEGDQPPRGQKQQEQHG
jgi:hypothetical protein